MGIFKKMALISAEMTTVAKNLKVGYGNMTYKAVAENDIIEAVKPLETKHGVYSYPIGRKVIDQQIIEGEKNDKMFLRIETTYRFVDVDDESFIEVISIADGVDTQDKAPGKAMTYADKYALMKAYKIPTGEDPDKDASEPFKKTPNTDASIPKSEAHHRVLKQLTADIEPEMLVATLKARYGVERIEDLNQIQSTDMMLKLEQKAKTPKTKI
jgi:hypothetical protein